MKPIPIPAFLIAILAGLFPGLSRAESVKVEWEKRYNGPGNNRDEPNGVAVDSAGNVIVTGQSVGILRNIMFEDFDYYTAKYAAADGALIWERRYDGPFNRDDYSAAVAVDNVGNVIVTGGSVPIPTGIRWPDFYTAKYAAADGALLWERRYNGPANGGDSAANVAVDSAGNVIVAGGSSSTAFDSYDYYTAKYAAADGALLWEKRYNGPANGDDHARGLVVDSAGNVIVTGYSYNSGGNSDFYTAKYAAANGALIWEKRYNGIGNGDEGRGYGVEVEVDSAGNAIVSGPSTGSGGNYDYYTAKYAAVDGALLWEKRYNGPANGFDACQDLAVDDEGNAIVTGYSEGGGGISDFYTAKYAAVNGALIWEKRYNGTGVGYEVALDVEVDNAGNPVVFGVSLGSSGNRDYYTAKYAAATGALIWERREAAMSAPGVGSLALTPDGGAVVAGAMGPRQSANDFYTVKYAPVDLDLDDDGLPDSWEIEHFGDGEGQSALDDTDGDGAVELLEFAFNTDPRAPNSVPAPAVVIEGGYLTTTITKQSCVRYLVETGAALEAGFSATNTTVLTDTGTTLKVRDNVLMGTQPARFLRVHISAPP